MEGWSCNNCEHVNNVRNHYCDVCDAEAPQLENVKFSDVNSKGEFKVEFTTLSCDKLTANYGVQSFTTDLKTGYFDFVFKDIKELEFILENRITRIVKSIRIELNDPEIFYFKTNKTFLENCAENTVKISWSVSTSFDLDLDGERLDEIKGEKTFELSKARNFTLRVKNALGIQTEKSLFVDVSKESPCIEEFYFSPSELKDENPTKIKWLVKGAKRVDIIPIGIDMGEDGEVEFHTLKDTPVRLTAWSYFGVKSEEENIIRVSRNPPEIKSFTSDFEYVFPNHEITINWNIDSAKEIKVYNIDGEELYCGPDIEGSLKYKVLKQEIFRIRAENIFGFISEKKVMINTLPVPKIDKLVTSIPEIKSEIKFDKIQLNPNVKIELDTMTGVGELPAFPGIEPISLNIDVIKPPEISRANIDNEGLFSKLTKTLRDEIKKRTS